MTASLTVAFVHVVLPVLIITGVGYALGRFRPIDPGPVTTLSVSVLTPVVSTLASVATLTVLLAVLVATGTR